MRARHRCKRGMHEALAGIFGQEPRRRGGDWTQLLVPAGLVAMFLLPLFVKKPKEPPPEEEKKP